MTAKTQPSFYKNVLHQTVESAANVNDLLPMLQLIPVHQIKCFINQQIEELDANSCKNAYFNSSSINQIFPDDIMQLILSFDGLYHTKSVNRKWNKLCHKNEQIEIIKTNKSINNTQPIEPKYDTQTNKTWIIHPFRKTLHRKEIELGYVGPMSDIKNVINQCQSGDRLLIHDGIYNFNESLFIEDDIQLIGVGNNVIIKDISDDNDAGIFCGINDWRQDISVPHSIYFENITFDCSESLYITDGCIHVHDNNKLLMNNIKLKFCCNALTIRKGAYLEIKNSEFIGQNNTWSAIQIFPTAKEVNIENCVFKQCGMGDSIGYGEEEACILIYDCFSNEVNETTDIDEFVKLKCIGNVFENNFCYPIAERHAPYTNNINRTPSYHANDKFIIGTDRYILKDNVLRGFNGTKVKKQIDIIDGNTIYYNDELSKGANPFDTT